MEPEYYYFFEPHIAGGNCLVVISKRAIILHMIEYYHRMGIGGLEHIGEEAVLNFCATHWAQPLDPTLPLNQIMRIE